jgi:hypothetical protein
MKVQVTSIQFDLDEIDVLQNPNLSEQLQEEYVGLIYDLEDFDADDDEVGDELIEEITAQSGWLINSLNFRYILS